MNFSLVRAAHRAPCNKMKKKASDKVCMVPKTSGTQCLISVGMLAGLESCHRIGCDASVAQTLRSFYIGRSVRSIVSCDFKIEASDWLK